VLHNLCIVIANPDFSVEVRLIGMKQS